MYFNVVSLRRTVYKCYVCRQEGHKTAEREGMWRKIDCRRRHPPNLGRWRSVQTLVESLRDTRKKKKVHMSSQNNERNSTPMWTTLKGLSDDIGDSLTKIFFLWTFFALSSLVVVRSEILRERKSPETLEEILQWIFFLLTFESIHIVVDFVIQLAALTRFWLMTFLSVFFFCAQKVTVWFLLIWAELTRFLSVFGLLILQNDFHLLQLIFFSFYFALIVKLRREVFWSWMNLVSLYLFFSTRELYEFKAFSCYRD